MRVLVSCIPQAGHVNPLLPTLDALARDGAKVVVASAPSVQAQVEHVGASFVEVCSEMDSWFGTLAERTRGAPGDGLPPERILYYFAPRLFGEVALNDMLDRTLDLARDWSPDLILHDAYALTGPLVADAVGARSVNHQFGPLPPLDVLDLVNDAVTPAWRSVGRQSPQWAGVYRDRTVLICPPSLDSQRPPDGTSLWVRPTALPDAPIGADADGPPLVYVTFGTVWARSDLVADVLAALADLPVEVLVTTGAVDPTAVTAPDNAHVERFVPQREVLPRASAVVHHAGAGTMFAALAHGLPQVALPQAADNFINAGMLEHSGAGIALPPDSVEVDRVRDAVRAVLAEPQYRSAAVKVADELAAMPSVETLAQQLRP